MARRSIEETFRAIKPPGYRGIPSAPEIGAGFASSSDLSTSLSQAGQQIALLQSAYQQQAALIAANTQAIQGNTSAQGSRSSVGSAIGTATSSLGGGLGLLSPLISGIASLFGGGSSQPAPLPIYVPPAPVEIDGNLRNTTSIATPATSLTAPPTQTPGTTHVTVNVNAMDSQSFMDRSADIASAVREAMLNLHPINDVVANL